MQLEIKTMRVIQQIEAYLGMSTWIGREPLLKCWCLQVKLLSNLDS